MTAASFAPPAQAQEAEEVSPAPESEETAPAEVPDSETESRGNDFAQSGGSPMPEDSTQTQRSDGLAREYGSVTDGAQEQEPSSSGDAGGQNQAWQRQPGSSPGEEADIHTERENMVLLAASLACLPIGLAVVFLYPRKH